MVTTNDEKLYKKLMQLRTHGITKDPDLMHENHGGWYMEMQTLGYNYRIPDVLCALGVSQLERAELGLKRRHEIASVYSTKLAGLPIVLPNYDEGHAFHLYVIQTKQRKALYDYLRTQNIFCQVHYIPVHLHPYYQAMGHKKGDYPIAEAYYGQCLSLPMYPTLTESEQQFVIDKISGFFNAKRNEVGLEASANDLPQT
jgi:dTDP-4-amino-4,6-dideoxygalactose transaminase